MSTRQEESFESESESSSSGDDGRFNRLKSTVRRTSGANRRRRHSESEEEGLYTGSESDSDDQEEKPTKDEKVTAKTHPSKSRSDSPKETSEKSPKVDARERIQRNRENRQEERSREKDAFSAELEEYKNQRDKSRRGDRSERGRQNRDGDRDRERHRERRGDRMDNNVDRRDRDRDRRRPRSDRERDEERSRSDRGGDGDRSRNGDARERTSSERNEQKRKRDEDDKKDSPGQKDGETGATVPKKPKKDDLLTTRTGGAYIPPARLRMMQQNITDKSSEAYQRISWEALKKSINGLVNKVNVSNIVMIVRELFGENLVRGRGLIARSIIQAQAASSTFTHVYAALVAIINTKFPQNGELILKRLIIQFKRGYRRNDKMICLTATKFLGHLVNQQVAHEVIALEILTLLLENPTDDSVEIAVGFLKEVGQKLTDVSPRGIHAIFERLRNILHEASIDKRVQYMIEVMFAVRKDGFKDHVSVLQELDVVEEEEQFTHLLTLDDVSDGEDMLNVFKADPEFLENEEKYKDIKKSILDSDSSDDDGSGSGSGSDSSDSDDEEDEEAKQVIIDNTETNLVALRRTIYLTIQSSLDFEECAHKLMKMELKPGQEIELCNMILDCCAQQRTFEKFYALLGQRFCQIDKKFIAPNEVMFQEQYETIHRLETAKLRNVAKFFAHLLHTDAISWGVLQAIKLNEDDTTSSSRIFIKILFQELSEFMGLPKLNTRLKDMTLAPFFEGLFPRDNPRNTRFAINFFTSIGLGGLTDELRDHLKSQPKKAVVEAEEPESSSSESESSSESSSSSSDSDSSSESEPTPKKNKKKGRNKKKPEPSPPAKKSKQKKKQRKVSVNSDSESEPEQIDKRKKNKNRENIKRNEKQYEETSRKSRKGKENVLTREDDRPSRKNKERKSIESEDSDDQVKHRAGRDNNSDKNGRHSRQDRDYEKPKRERSDSYERNYEKAERPRKMSRERKYSEEPRRQSNRRR